eukprot:3506644-Rhodomonas_salina.1
MSIAVIAPSSLSSLPLPRSALYPAQSAEGRAGKEAAEVEGRGDGCCCNRRRDLRSVGQRSVIRDRSSGISDQWISEQ